MPNKRSNPTERRKSADSMLVIRGSKDIKKPTEKEIQAMKNREFMRKNPNTNA